MRYRSSLLVLCITVCNLALADVPEGYRSDKAPGEYDEVLQCIVNVAGVCETEYVEEVLELCRDCDIAVPEIAGPSWVEEKRNEFGLSLVEKLIEHPVKSGIIITYMVLASAYGTYKGAKALKKYYQQP